MRAQPGIFAVGTTDHAYLELDATGSAQSLVDAVAEAAGALASNGGVNLVVGFRPSVWASVADADQVPAGVEDWTAPIVGPDGFTHPATPHDAWLWLAGGDRGVVFDETTALVRALAPAARVATLRDGWVYKHDRDLTGFVDGTENPGPLEAPDVSVVPDGHPGAGSSVLLFQLWSHDTARWEARAVEEQERVIGRTKADSVELPDDIQPADSHVARTVVEVDGEEQDIYRRNVAYGGPDDHGTVFVGFSRDQWRLAEMLRRMAGVGDGVRDALTRYTTPTTGAYYVVPSFEALAARTSDQPTAST